MAKIRLNQVFGQDMAKYVTYDYYLIEFKRKFTILAAWPMKFSTHTVLMVLTVNQWNLSILVGH